MANDIITTLDDEAALTGGERGRRESDATQIDRRATCLPCLASACADSQKQPSLPGRE